MIASGKSKELCALPNQDVAQGLWKCHVTGNSLIGMVRQGSLKVWEQQCKHHPGLQVSCAALPHNAQQTHRQLSAFQSWTESVAWLIGFSLWAQPTFSTLSQATCYPILLPTIVPSLALTLCPSPCPPAHLLQKATMATCPTKIILSNLLNHKILELLSSHYPVLVFIFQFPNLTISTAVTGSMFFFIPHNSWYNDQRKHLIIFL